MAARKTPSAGGKPDKLMRDALSLELHKEIEVPDPDGVGDPSARRKVKVKKLRLVALGLVNKAIRGDVPAAKEIIERMDGKVAQPIKGTGPGGAIGVYDLSRLTDEQLDQFEQLARLAAAAAAGGDS